MARSSLLVLVLVLVACARRPEEVPATTGQDVSALVAEAVPERVVLLTEDRDLVSLEAAPGTAVSYEGRALPGLAAVMEGDRVRASFEEGQAGQLTIERSADNVTQVAVRRATHGGEPLPAWSDTMRDPGGGIGSSRWVGTWGYVPPVWRFGPPPKNAVTGRPTPADQRPSF